MLTRAFPIAILLGCLATGIVGCSEGNPISETIAPATPSFIAERPPAGVNDHVAALQERSVAGGRIVLDVVLTEIDEPILGIALRLTYPERFSKFVSCSDGDLLPPGSCVFDEPAEGSGEVFIGRGVSVPTDATPVAGSRVIARLEFLVFAAGEGPIVIEGQNLGGSESSAVLDVDGNPIPLQWFSGTLRGEQGG